MKKRALQQLEDETISKTSRQYKKTLCDFVVSEEDVLKCHALLIRLTNEIDGPEVAWDDERGCNGLRARKDYTTGQLITTYGGIKTVTETNGDYATKASADIHIDGHYGFMLSEKGRWINESDRNRTLVNVKLGRNVRASQSIQAGEWIFADYGPDYDRSHYP